MKRRVRGKENLIETLSILFILLVTPPALAQRGESGYKLEEKKVRAVVREVLESQQDPQAHTSKLKALEEYEAFIRKHFEYKSDLKAEAMHRLADLYIQLETNTHRKKLQEYAERLGLYVKGKIPQRPQSPRIDHSKSISIYNEILKQYPERQENDSVLYQLAHGYSDEANIDQATEALQRLVTQYPTSSLRQEAYFRLGEFFFELGRHENAIQAYEKALQAPSEDFLEIALYKKGWAYFAKRQYEQSIDTFLTLLDRRAVLTEAGEKRPVLHDLPPAERQLLEDAIRALPLAFDELGGSAHLTAYLEKKGRRDYEDYLFRSLADLYLRQERHGEAVATLETFLRTHPTHREAPYLMAKIIEIQTDRKKPDSVLKAKEALIGSFGKESLWYQEASETDRQRFHPLYKETSYELVLYAHAKAQQTKQAEDYKVSVARARQFLSVFPRAVERARVNFLLAEGLFELKRYEESAREYEITAFDYPLHPQSRDAAYNFLIALEQVPTEASPPLREAIRRFVNQFPEDPQIPRLLLKSAQYAFGLENYPAARQDAEQVIRLNLQEPALNYQARKLIALSYFKEGNYAQAARDLEELLGLEIPKEDEKELRTFWASSLYKLAEEQKAAGNRQEAARRFIQLYEEMPGTPIGERALLDSATLSVELGQYQEAIGSLKRFLEAYPQSDRRKESLEQLALLHEKQEEFPKAIETYRQLAEASDPIEAAQWYWIIGELSEKMEDWKGARQAFLRVSEKNPNEDKNLQALWRAAQASDRLEEPEQVEALLHRILESYKRLQNPSAQMAYTASEAHLELAERRFQDFKAVQLVAPLEANLERKRGLLKEALGHYSKVVDFKIPGHITAATYKTGVLFEEFRDALLNSERPEGLTPQQLEQYSFLLEEQAYPFEEKAIAAYEANIRHAQQQALYDEWVKKSYQKLGLLLPAKYARPEMEEIFAEESLF